MSAAAITAKRPPRYALRVYKDARGEFRWRMTSVNGRIVADSGEGYTRRAGAVAAARRLIEADISLANGGAL